MNQRTRALPRSFWWSVGSLGLMVAGALGPWVKVAGLLTINGTDDGGDGWVVLGAAAVAALALLLYVRFRRGWLIVFPLLAGVAGAATAAYDINNIRRLGSGDALFGALVGTQWGIYVALIGSISLVLASLGVVVESHRGLREDAALLRPTKEGA